MYRRLISVTTAVMLVAGLLALMSAGAAASMTAYKWTSKSPGTSLHCNSVFTLDANHIWVGCQGGRVLFYNGASWSIHTTPATDTLYGVWASGPDDAWAVGTHGTILHFNGATWSLVPSPTTKNLYAIWGTWAKSIWAVGETGTILFYDGWAWSRHPFSPTDSSISGVSGLAGDSVWITTYHGDVYRWKASSWKLMAITATPLMSVFALDENHVWVVGYNGLIMKYGGFTWVNEGGITTSKLFKVYATSAENAWIVGQNGLVLNYNGSNWTSEISGTSRNLRSVCAVDTNSVWAVGDAGTVLLGEPYDHPTWYLAEGCNAPGYETSLTIENPNETEVSCLINYMTSTGPVDGGVIDCPAKSVNHVNTRDTVPGQDFSTKVKCLERKTIAVERTISWPGPDPMIHDSHSSIGATASSRTWYLPEGCSDYGFECWLLIQNPNKSEAECQVTYMIDGEAPVTVTKAIPADSRRTFNMADDIGAKSASIKVVGNVPVISERSMYRNARRGGHNSLGATAAASDYYLAEGCTAWGFTTYVLVQNPNSTPTDVEITYMTSGTPIYKTPFTMAPNTRRTIRVNDDVPNTDVSTRVHGSQPIIAERALYWDGGLGEAMHDSIGITAPHSTFYLPDGRASWRAYIGNNTYTLVQNPNPTEVRVEISYLRPGGTGTIVFSDNIPQRSRKTYALRDRLNGEASIIVRSETPGKKIMVERATYMASPGCPLAGGTCTIGGYSD